MEGDQVPPPPLAPESSASLIFCAHKNKFYILSKTLTWSVATALAPGASAPRAARH
jgi:hypothetical protein